MTDWFKVLSLSESPFFCNAVMCKWTILYFYICSARAIEPYLSVPLPLYSGVFSCYMQEKVIYWSVKSFSQCKSHGCLIIALPPTKTLWWSRDCSDSFASTLFLSLFKAVNMRGVWVSAATLRIRQCCHIQPHAHPSSLLSNQVPAYCSWTSSPALYIIKQKGWRLRGFYSAPL